MRLFQQLFRVKRHEEVSDDVITAQLLPLGHDEKASGFGVIGIRCAGPEDQKLLSSGLRVGAVVTVTVESPDLPAAPTT